MLTEEHVKEGLSQAYVSAVINHAGMDCGLSSTQFDYGIDGCISEVKVRPGGRRISSGFKIDFQLKSTVNITMNGDKISYELKAKTYNDLVDSEVGTPRILILYVLPTDNVNWVTVSEERLELKNCAWWVSLRGLAPTNNSSSITIQLPRNQLFTVDEVKRLMQLVKGGVPF